MYWLIEDVDQLTNFYNSSFKTAFVDVISLNDNIHPCENDICAVYIRPMEASKGFMIGISHNDTLQVKKEWVYKILKSYDTLYCTDKKRILHYLFHPNLEDILLPPNKLDLPDIKVYSNYYVKYKNEKNVNTFIPIVKHYEWCELVFNAVKPLIQQNKTKYYEFYNNKVSVVFNAIERAGLCVNTELFTDYFHPISTNRVYTQYNLNTTTTRPSNKFNGVNYAALNRKNGERRSFTSQNGKLVEFDVTAMHPTLASHLINYTFTDSDIHSSFATMYGVDRDKAKELTFKQLYGGVFKQYKSLPFFKRIQKYIDNTWEIFQTTGQVEAPVSGYMFRKDKLENMTPQKLFNYILQNLETSTNSLVLWDIFHILRGKNTKVVLYTYDSILLDYDENENLLADIQKTFEKRKLFTTKKTGYDYDFN